MNSKNEVLITIGEESSDQHIGCLTFTLGYFYVVINVCEVIKSCCSNSPSHENRHETPENYEQYSRTDGGGSTTH